MLGQQWWQATLLSAGRLLFDYLCLLFSVRAVGAHPRPSLILLAYAVAGIIGLVPITPGGLGIVEASLSGLLVLAGLTGVQAVLATLAYRLASYWLPLLSGPFAYGAFKYRYRDPQAPPPVPAEHVAHLERQAGLGCRSGPTAQSVEPTALRRGRPEAVGPAGCRGRPHPSSVTSTASWSGSVTLAQARRPSGVRQATTARVGGAAPLVGHRVGLDGDLALGVGVRRALGEGGDGRLGIGPGEPGGLLGTGALGERVAPRSAAPAGPGSVP